MLKPENAVVAAILVCLMGALLTLALSHHRRAAGWAAFAVAATGASLVLYAGWRVLTTGPGLVATYLEIPAMGFALRIAVDGLTAIFLLLAALITLAASLYSISYMEHYAEQGVARYYPWFLVFQAAMYGLVSTTDMMWFFFIFWQMMTLPGYALIRFDKQNRAHRRAANKYLIMMQIACLVTMAGAEILAATGPAAPGLSPKYDFETVSARLPDMLRDRGTLTAVAFGLFLAGFGIKMGMWPFGQIWLPDAHPAAPSPVSAMLSGVMIKTGVYGLMRYFLWLTPSATLSDFPIGHWGVLVAGLGTVTLLTGTTQALRQEQSKRLLAFHSIGQIGYILLGLGACMILLAVGSPHASLLASIGFLGALFHTLNHGFFKGLLFLNAGSLLYATGTQDLNRMGGLMRLMPVTALTALVAALSISGVPLFNGFASKWAIYVAAIEGSPHARFLAVCAVLAILTSALTLASLTKFFGASFLAKPSPEVSRLAAERRPVEVGWMMRVPQIYLASFCVILGLVPGVGFDLLHFALDASRQGYGATLAYATPLISGPWLGLQDTHGTALLAPLAVAAMLALAFLLARLLAGAGGSVRRAGLPWLCGHADPAGVHRYPAHHFYGPLKRWLSWPSKKPPKSADSPSGSGANTLNQK